MVRSFGAVAAIATVALLALIGFIAYSAHQQNNQQSNPPPGSQSSAPAVGHGRGGTAAFVAPSGARGGVVGNAPATAPARGENTPVYVAPSGGISAGGTGGFGGVAAAAAATAAPCSPGLLQALVGAVSALLGGPGACG